jgi:uncharacterized protein
MKKIFAFFILGFVIAPCLFCQTDTMLVSISNKFLFHLIDHEYDSAYVCFDKTVQDKLPVEKLKEVWSGFDKQFGQLTDHSKMNFEKQKGYETIITTLVWEKTSLDMTLSFNKEKKIVGFFFKPAAAKNFSALPVYAVPDKYTETPIEVKSDSHVLPGLITVPKGIVKFPLIILVHGSGPNDKDETIGPNKPFRDIACGLATNGIAVMRYDKRSKIYGAEMSKLPNLTVVEEVLDDVVSAVKLAKTIPGVDTTKIFVLGHSLGGMLAPRIASIIPSLAGIIIMAGNSRPLEYLVLDQYKYILGLDGLTDADKETIANVQKQIDKMHSKSFDLNTPSIELPLNLPASYWWDLMNYNQKEIAAKLKLAMLFIQGEGDYQVTMIDFEEWKKTLEKNIAVQFISYPNLNHLFIEGPAKSVPADYEKSGNVSEKVIKDITEWIKTH